MWCKEEKSGNPFSESHFSPGQTRRDTQPRRTPEQLHKARAARSVAFPHYRKVSILPARLPSRKVCLSFRSQPQTGGKPHFVASAPEIYRHQDRNYEQRGTKFACHIPGFAVVDRERIEEFLDECIVCGV